MAKNNRAEDNACPIGGSINIFGGKWKPEIIYYLNQGPRRFNELRRLIPGVTQRMLTQQLRELERDGIIEREQFLEIPPKVVYSLSDLGFSLIAIFNGLETWGTNNMKKVERARKRYDEAANK